MREICCAVIDLKSGASDLLELGPQALESAGAAAHFCLLKPIWTEREDPVALSPGMLSGTGVPGSGGMTWCCPGAEGLTLTAAEGRLGAMLRYAGVEHLLFCGSCEGGQTVDVLVHDGRISVTKHARTQGMPAGRIYAEARKRQPDENSVIAVFTASGVLEDDCFSVGDRALSARLRKKGLRSLTVAASGGVPVARPRQFTDQCVALWESWRRTARRWRRMPRIRRTICPSAPGSRSPSARWRTRPRGRGPLRHWGFSGESRPGRLADFKRQRRWPEPILEAPSRRRGWKPWTPE